MDSIYIILSVAALFISIITLFLCFIILIKMKKDSSGADLRSENEKLREKLSAEFSSMRTELNTRIDNIQSSLASSMREGLQSGNSIQSTALSRFSQETQNYLNSFSDKVTLMVNGIDTRMTELRKDQDEKLENIRLTTERKITELQVANQQKLDEMQKTVDEKLQKSLESRVTESFKIVGERLEQVYKSLGEMQTLASGVGDLKKILANVKTRGIFGEIQLSRILEQLLTKDQYDENVATKKGSRDSVEFAIKLPGRNDSDEPVLLPIDAKFPLDVFTTMLDAYETGDAKLAEQASKSFESSIKKSAKDIRDKYIDPPNTTDFAIMFLPTESLYAEVVKRVTLLEELARVYNVNVSGPSTVSAFLNSLQMGFRTLAIEKRSHEVWNLLSAVKTEFESFDEVLLGVKKRLEAAESDLSKLVGVRTRAVLRKLKDVQALPKADAERILGNPSVYDENDSEAAINNSEL